MKNYISIVLVLITVLGSGCFLTKTGKNPIPSNLSKVYYWYTDGTVSCGNSSNPVAHKSYYSYAVDNSKKIIAVGIANNDHVYYWYDDNTVSEGTTDKPLHYSREYYDANQSSTRVLIGAAIAGDNKVYYWYSGGTVGSASSGTTNDPTKYRDYYTSDIMKPPKLTEPIAMGIDGFYDHVYYWYPDTTVNSGTTDRAGVRLGYYDSNLEKEVVGIAIRNGKQ